MIYVVKYWSDDFIIKYWDNKDFYVLDFAILCDYSFLSLSVSLSLSPLPLDHLFGLCFDVAELGD